MPKKETTVNKRVGKEKKSVESKELESKSHSNTKSYKKATYPDWVQEANSGTQLKLRKFKSIIPYNGKQVEKKRGQVRVLKIYNRFANVTSALKKWPSVEEYERFNVCKNTRYQDLSPMVLGPVHDENKDLYAENIEDGWQCSKVWPSHIGVHDKDGDKWLPNWEEWSKRGRFSKEARRHRRPKQDAKVKVHSNPNIPLFSYYMKKRLTYKKARERMYMSWYKTLVVKTDAYKDLKARLDAGINLLLVEYDGLDRTNPLENKDLDEKMLINLLDDDTKPFGHGLVLASVLLDLPVWEYDSKKRDEIITI